MPKYTVTMIVISKPKFTFEADSPEEAHRKAVDFLEEERSTEIVEAYAFCQGSVSIGIDGSDAEPDEEKYPPIYHVPIN